ncbi:hypothetical protein G6011_00843 [Alternaria panax]|uniref:Heterokaryon incompatibility domain-containing protein n=1 Tax=Alternaria panax TaxID=48097 RepID=A0AAD4IJI3_9PLEO|nr:hypothetical protein G6011_00843 [Alternaria panax]
MRNARKRTMRRDEQAPVVITRPSERIPKRREVTRKRPVPATKLDTRATRRKALRRAVIPGSSQPVSKCRTASRKRPEQPTMPKIYKHQPLEIFPTEIRLVKLRREKEGPVHCKLEVFSFYEVPEYIALSYRWGPPTPLHNIFIGRKMLRIRDILNSCLLELREDLDTWLWIDQICIDQSNPQERNHQVGIMSRIYSMSTSVIVWLGDIPKDRRFSDTYLTKSMAMELMGNIYFTRLWIVQEIVLAKSVKVCINGHRHVKWRTLQDTYLTIRRRDRVDAHGYLKRPTYLSLLKLTEDDRRGKLWDKKDRTLTLMDSIGSFCSSSCEDPRDKVYGLMGVMRVEDRIRVDYGKSVCSVYLDVVVVSLNQTPLERGQLMAGVLGDLGHHMGIEEYLTQGLHLLFRGMKDKSVEESVEDVGFQKAAHVGDQDCWWYRSTHGNMFYYFSDLA